MAPGQVNINSEPGLLNTNWGPGPINTNWGPGPVNANRGPGPVNTNWGPGLGAKERAGGREMQIPLLFIVNRVKLKLIKRIGC